MSKPILEHVSVVQQRELWEAMRSVLDKLTYEAGGIGQTQEMDFQIRYIGDARKITVTFAHGPRYYHIKSEDHTYEVVGEGRAQARDPLKDMEAVTVYRGDDGSLWVRRKSEFEDGRFLPVSEDD